MLKLDTVGFDVAGDAISHINRDEDLWDKDVREKQGACICYRLKLPDNARESVYGLKSLVFDMRADRVHVELSAKILRANYFDLITANTIGQVVDGINYNPMIKFDANKFIDTARVHHCDTTENLQVEHEVHNYIRAIRAIPYPKKYNAHDYEKAGVEQSVIIKNQNKTVDERMIFYDKASELMLARNKRLVSYMTRDDWMKFQNTLRAECNHRSLDDMRKRFGIKAGEDILLTSVLGSKEKVNYKTFHKMASGCNDPLLFHLEDELSSFKRFSDYEKFKGREAIVESLNCDIGLVRKLIRGAVRGNISRYMKDYRYVIASVRSKKSGENGIVSGYIPEVEHLLRTA